MKTILNTIAISFALAGSAFAESPLVPLPVLGEEAGIRALLNASVAYNDNIYLQDKHAKADTIFTISPGAEFSTGETGRNKATFRFIENILFYMDEDDNNRALENLDFTFSHGAEGDKLRCSVAAGFHHNQASSSRESQTPGHMTRSYNYYGNAIASYKVGEKTSVRSGFKWNGTTYDNSAARDAYNDRQQYAVPLYLYYAVTEKLNVGLSGEYRYVDLASSGRNRELGSHPGIEQVWFFGLSAEGRAWEKLSLNGRIGYTHSDYSRRTTYSDGSKSSLGASITANWRATEKLATALTVDRDFDIGGAGESILSTGVSLSGDYKINDFWSANASLSYRYDDYQSYSREDNLYTFRVGAAYAFNEYASAYANYLFSVDDSQGGQDYTNNVVTVGISLRY